MIAVFIVRILDEKKLFDNMHYVFLLFPTYAYVFILSILSYVFIVAFRIFLNESESKKNFA